MRNRRDLVTALIPAALAWLMLGPAGLAVPEENWPPPPQPDKIVSAQDAKAKEPKPKTGFPGSKLWMAYFVAGAKAMKLGQGSDARKLLGIANNEALHPSDYDRQPYSVELSNSHFGSAEMALCDRDLRTAEAEANAALQCDFKLFGSRNSASAADYELLGDIKAADGNSDAAERTYKIAIAVASDRNVPMQNVDTRTLRKLADLYQAAQRTTEANAIRPSISPSLLPCDGIASHFALVAKNSKYDCNLWDLAGLSQPSVKSANKPANPGANARGRKAKARSA